MGVGLDDLVNMFGEQNNLSGVQQWVAAGGAKADPDYSQLAQLAPRTYATQVLPTLLQRGLQMQALNSAFDQNQQQSSQQSALAQYGNSGDQDPNASIPQGFPSVQQQQPQQQPTATQSNSALKTYQLALALGNGNLEQGFKTLQAQRALQVPPGVGTIPQGQQYVNGTLQNIPGAMTEGQKDRDNAFAELYTPFKNAGGQTAAKSQLDAIQGVIDDLQNGKVKTGNYAAMTALNNEGEPSRIAGIPIGGITDPDLIVASNQVAKAVLPSSKALFGARVTQGEVFRNLMANGLNPYATNDENIKNLTTLKGNLANAQQSISQAGEYFDKNGTLAGYRSSVPGIDAGGTPLNPQGALNQPNPALIDTLRKRGLIK